MTALPLLVPETDCWNRIGVRGDRSCPELVNVGHCHNCNVFAAAGRRFLDGPCPPGYQDEWTERLLAPLEAAAADLQSVLIFRLADEWLALPVAALVEVTNVRPVHRVPFHGGMLAGIVNVRGELHLCVHLAGLLGLNAARAAEAPGEVARAPTARLLVVRREHERWVFPVEEVGQVHRFAAAELRPVPATVARADARLTRGVLTWDERPVGVLDERRLFESLRAKLR
jgi:chemotaxis-related protein WspD